MVSAVPPTTHLRPPRIAQTSLDGRPHDNDGGRVKWSPLKIGTSASDYPHGNMRWAKGQAVVGESRYAQPLRAVLGASTGVAVTLHRVIA